MNNQYPFLIQLIARLIKEKKMYNQFKKTLNFKTCISILNQNIVNIMNLSFLQIIHRSIKPQYKGLDNTISYQVKSIDFAADINVLVMEYIQNDFITLLYQHDAWLLWEYHLKKHHCANPANFWQYLKKNGYSVFKVLGTTLSHSNDQSVINWVEINQLYLEWLQNKLIH